MAHLVCFPFLFCKKKEKKERKSKSVRTIMPGPGYWITTYKSISSPDKLAQYAKLALPAIESGGGRFLVRSPAPNAVYEAGLTQRTVVIKFESVEKAVATYDSPAYKEALVALQGGCEREIRICEGVE